MKIVDKTGVRGIEGVQIESGAHQLRVRLAAAAGFNPEGVTLRLGLTSSKLGTKVLRDKMSITALAEMTAFGTGEGHFERNRHATNANLTTVIDFVFDVSKNGVLPLNDGAFLSLDIKGDNGLDDGQTFDLISVSTMDAPTISADYEKSEPFFISEGITRDINLVGVDEVVMPLDQVERIQITSEGKATEYTQEELKVMARALNDIVSVDTVTGVATYGIKRWMLMQLIHATKMTVTPADGGAVTGGFYVYLNRTKEAVA